jgi:two-component sensor histidine kinase
LAVSAPAVRQSGHGLPIGLYLVASTLAVALPLLAFVALLLWQLEQSEQAALERRTVREATSLASAVGRQLNDITVTLRLLVVSPELEAGDLRAFHNRTQAALRRTSQYLILVREDGQQLLNTRVPFGTPLGKTSNLQALQTAIDSDNIGVSDVFFGATSERWVFNVTLPLPEQLRSQGAALIMTQNASELGRLVTTDGLPPGWSATLVDGSGATIVSSENTRPGEPLPAELLAHMTKRSGIIENGKAGEIIGYARLPGWSWRAVISGPVAAAQASILSTWRLLLVGGSALLLLAIGAAYVMGMMVRNSIGQIAEMAERLGRGEVVSPVRTGIAEADLVAIALTNASFDRSQAEERTSFILHELVHRAKNLLALVQAMLRQTAKHSRSVTEFQAVASGRIEGLSRSIDLLTVDDWKGVSFRRLVETHLKTFIDAPGRLEIRGQDFLLKPEAVQNMGLVFHELATNAVKYGALSVPEGKIMVEWTDDCPEAQNPSTVLRWLEIGGPRVNPPKRKGFGSTIIEQFIAASLGAAVKVEFAPDGLQWTMTAPTGALRKPGGTGQAATRAAQLS